MATRKAIRKHPQDMVGRNIALVKEVMRYLLDHPQVLTALPDGFELVVLPEDDPEMRLYNLELLDVYGSQGKPIVFARVRSGQAGETAQPSLRLYAPVAA